LLTHNNIKLIVGQSKSQIQKTRSAIKHFDHYLHHYHPDNNINQIDDNMSEYLKDENIMPVLSGYLATVATCRTSTDGALISLSSALAFFRAINMFLTERFPECANYRCFHINVYKDSMMNILNIKSFVATTL
jgi:hypothetical protein